MSITHYQQTLEIAQEHGEIITLGGGEPTLHPEFWPMLGLALSYEWEIPPLIVTNGKNKQSAKALANLARCGAIGAELSIDEYHDPIDPTTIAAFTKKEVGYPRIYTDYRAIRTVPTIVKRGRAQWASTDKCCCETILIHPTGRVYACGCRRHKLGTLDQPLDWSAILAWSNENNCGMNDLEGVKQLANAAATQTV